MKRIGFYGGRFNPIHYAHLILARTALEELRLDRVIFVPSGGRACYKTEDDVAPGPDRFAMTQRAVQTNPQFEVSSYEINREGFSYTVDTLRHFRDHELTDSEIVLLAGGDWLNKIPSWKEGNQLLQEFGVAVFSRPGGESKADPDIVKQSKSIQFINMPLIDISSSMIRERIHQGLSIQYLTPEPVCRYIEERGLYK